MTDELRELARVFDDLLGTLLPLERLLDGAAADRQMTSEARAGATELGLHAVALAEDDGGFGRRPDWIASLMQVAGRRLLPTVLRDEAMLLAPILAESSHQGDPESAGWLDALQSGSGSGVARGVVAGPDLERIEATPTGFACSDLPVCAPSQPQAVAVATPHGAWVIDPADRAVHIEPVDGIELGAGAARLSVDHTPIEPSRYIAADIASGLLDIWQLSLLAESVGCCELVTELSAEYASERRQFDRPIASFQAVAHLLADMKQRTELGRSVLSRAVTLMHKGGGEELDDLLIAARHWIPKAAREAIENGIQVQGGMGFTWEVGLHLWYRRALHIQALLGGEAGSAGSAGSHFTNRARSQQTS